jgi:hypothetical protein
MMRKPPKPDIAKGSSAYHGVMPFWAEPRFSRWVAGVSFIC